MKNIQLHKMFNKTAQYGIGLLELMLSLTIIAILLIAATRYYQSTQTARQIQVAVESIQAVYTATQQYYNDKGDVPTDLNILVVNAMLPSNFETFANPWGGKTAGSGVNKQFTLTFSKNVPQTACTNIHNKIQSNYPDSNIDVKCPSDIGDMSIVYTLP